MTAKQKYVPELVWPTPYKNNPGITWRTLAGQIRYDRPPREVLLWAIMV
jgi:hypothetical protein